MSLKRSEVNPLSVLNLRKLSFVPKHFSKVSVNIRVDQKMLDHWINYNLSGRYAIVKSLSLDEKQALVETLEIGFEDPKEITMFTLGCPYIGR